MATIVTRAAKGSPLTHVEVDANFTNLNTDKAETADLATVATTGAYADLSGTPTAYTDAAVDTHLNTGTATTGEVLSWTGTDYDWIAAGGGGSALELYAENPVSPTAPSATGNNAVAIGSGATASGGISGTNSSVAIGTSALASSNASAAFGGSNARANGVGSIALGYSPLAGSTFSAAIGYNSVTATGSNATALTNSYASGTDSFAAAIANNTSSYGATGVSCVAHGQQAKATTGYSFAHGLSAQAVAASAIALGQLAQASANDAIALGRNSLAAILSKVAIGSGMFSTQGDAQTGILVLRSDTTDATPEALTSNNSTAGTTNQVILPNSSAYSLPAAP
jgi:trimeric autotransporter adhesin